MKPFKINRKSWHYKLNKNFLNEDGWSEVSMKNSWEPKHSNFCSYWRATIIRLIVATFLAFIVIICLYGGVVGAYQNPIIALKVVASGVAFLVGITGVVLIMIYFDRSKEKLNDNLFVQKYKVHKSKICPEVEYKE